MTAHKQGCVTISARIGGAKAEKKITVSEETAPKNAPASAPLRAYTNPLKMPALEPFWGLVWGQSAADVTAIKGLAALDCKTEGNLISVRFNSEYYSGAYTVRYGFSDSGRLESFSVFAENRGAEEHFLESLSRAGFTEEIESGCFEDRDYRVIEAPFRFQRAILVTGGEGFMYMVYTLLPMN